MSLSICTTIFVLFGLLVLIGTSMALMVKLVKNTPFEILMSALILAMFFLTIIGIFEGHVGKAIKYWQAASPINRAEMQKRIEALERALTESMAKRFKWDAKADEKV
jgi:3-hydroxyisobutyrate dehydrogenase-like beta-hydroxyacid dehydrogenase